MIQYRILTDPSGGEAMDLTKLLRQLSTEKHVVNSSINVQDIKRTVENGCIIVAHDPQAHGFIVGMASLFPIYTLMGKIGWCENIVVDEKYRRQGIATKIMEIVLETAKESGCQTVEWMSGDYRTAAKSFYERLGAVSRQQTMYSYDL